MAEMLTLLAEFELEKLRECVKAGMASSTGTNLGRPASAASKAVDIQRLNHRMRLTKSR